MLGVSEPEVASGEYSGTIMNGSGNSLLQFPVQWRFWYLVASSARPLGSLVGGTMCSRRWIRLEHNYLLRTAKLGCTTCLLMACCRYHRLPAMVALVAVVAVQVAAPWTK
jgi:hypothetical protein